MHNIIHWTIFDTMRHAHRQFWTIFDTVRHTFRQWWTKLDTMRHTLRQFWTIFDTMRHTLRQFWTIFDKRGQKMTVMDNTGQYLTINGGFFFDWTRKNIPRKLGNAGGEESISIIMPSLNIICPQKTMQEKCYLAAHSFFTKSTP